MLKMKIITALLIFGTSLISTIKAQQNCVTPENDYGICTQFHACPQLLSARRAQNREYVAAAERACGDNLFCCDHPSNPMPNHSRARHQQRRRQSTNREVISSLQPNPFTSQEAPQNRRRQHGQQGFAQQQPQQHQHDALNFRNIFNINEFDDGSGLGYRAGEFCRTPDSTDGSCAEINSCESLLRQLATRSNDPSFINYIRASNRNCGGSGRIVCCPATATRNPSQTSQPTRPSQAMPNYTPTGSSTATCGKVVRSFKKIVGGRTSKQGDWPWTALLAYPELGSGSPFKCGGALVSARHVITAAHCIRKDLSFVRLGDFNLSTDTETHHEDIGISRKEPHPNYNTANGRNDIGVVLLERSVRFNSNIQPICLPNTPQLRTKSYLDYNPFVVGWGKTLEGGASADLLQELQVPVLNNDVCRDSYRRVNRLISPDQFDATVICAGVLSGGKDTCQGDSGGPLMIPERQDGDFRFYLIGVVSYGVGCARPGVPGVYASVQYFMDWILQKLAN